MANLTDVIEILQNDPDFNANVTRWETIPESPADTVDFPDELHPVLKDALDKRGIKALYSHQGSAFQQVKAGRHVVVVTPTASGKTLCYNLPVMDSLLKNSDERALYLFPTKALSQDQQSELNEVILGGEIPLKVATYDGDTPSSIRVAARDSGRIVISNPDMLHSGILPNHPKWIKFMSNLRYVVIDEVHIYRGVFGSHLTNLIRRIKRIAAFYGTNPQFILCSATIGNPHELAERIIEQPVALVDNNGAPKGAKHLVLYNPPLVDRVQGIRRGVVLESQKLALKFLKKKIKTIVFAKSRLRTELIATYINKSLANMYTDNSRVRVESYRGGYLPGERRAIEKGLRDGSIHGVVSTNALELGIDIGGLDVAILAGFPGSISSSWQQAGRAGRRQTESLAILIANSSPMDQYMIGHPEYFFGRPPESAWIDPDNIFILNDHLKCASFELPFKEGETFGGEVGDLLDYLEEEGILRHTGNRYYWADRSYPAESISLRTSTPENVVIIDTTKGGYNVIGEMDLSSAKELIFDHAVYIHRGDQFHVQKLDLEERKCYVERSELNYYTDAVVKSEIRVLEEDETGAVNGTGYLIGDVLVRRQVSKFKKIKYQTHENIGYGDIFLPEDEMHTRGILIHFDEGTPSGEAFLAVPDELKEQVIARLGTLIKNVAPFWLLCDPRDIGIAERLRDPHMGQPTLYVYDRYPGGTGLVEGFSRHIVPILSAAAQLVGGCKCGSGCPSCIGPADDPKIQGNRKTAVVQFLTSWLGQESHG